MALARRESTSSGGSSRGVAFGQGDWDVYSQGREGERLATGVVGHFEGGCESGFLKRRGYLFKRTREPRVSRRPFDLFWGRVCMDVCMYAAAELLRLGGGRLGGRVRYAGGKAIQYKTDGTEGGRGIGDGCVNRWMDGSELGCAAR